MPGLRQAPGGSGGAFEPRRHPMQARAAPGLRRNDPVAVSRPQTHSSLHGSELEAGQVGVLVCVGAGEAELRLALGVDLEERLAAAHDVADLPQQAHAGGRIGRRAGALRDARDLPAVDLADAARRRATSRRVGGAPRGGSSRAPCAATMRSKVRSAAPESSALLRRAVAAAGAASPRPSRAAAPRGRATSRAGRRARRARGAARPARRAPRDAGRCRGRSARAPR